MKSILYFLFILISSQYCKIYSSQLATQKSLFFTRHSISGEALQQGIKGLTIDSMWDYSGNQVEFWSSCPLPPSPFSPPPAPSPFHPPPCPHPPPPLPSPTSLPRLQGHLEAWLLLLLGPASFLCLLHRWSHRAKWFLGNSASQKLSFA